MEFDEMTGGEGTGAVAFGSGSAFGKLFTLLQEVNGRCTRIEMVLQQQQQQQQPPLKKRKGPGGGPVMVRFLPDIDENWQQYADQLNQSHLQLIFASNYLEGGAQIVAELLGSSLLAVGPILYVVKQQEWHVWPEADYLLFMNLVLKRLRVLFSEWLQLHQTLIDESDEEFVTLWTKNSIKLSGGNITHEQMLQRLKKELCKTFANK